MDCTTLESWCVCVFVGGGGESDFEYSSVHPPADRKLVCSRKKDAAGAPFVREFLFWQHIKHLPPLCLPQSELLHSLTCVA